MEALRKLVSKVGTLVKIRADSEFFGQHKGVGKVVGYEDGWVEVEFEDGTNEYSCGEDCDIELADAERELFNAIHDKDSDKIKLILETGLVDVNDCHNEWDETPLIDAVSRSNIGIVEVLVEAGADVNKPDSESQKTPLMTVIEEDIEILEYLLSNGADINAVDEEGRTALHIAVYNGEDKLVKFLIEKGIDVNIEAEDSNTAFEFAEISGDKNLIKAFGAIEQNSDDVKKLSEDECREQLRESIYERNVDRARKFIEANIINLDEEINGSDKPPIEIAINKGELEIVKALVSADADVNLRLSSDRTPLMAVPESRIEIAKYLVSAGADINLVDEDGWSALHYAVNCSEVEMTKFLISAGIDTSIKNNHGDTALDKAKRNNFKRILEAFGDSSDPVEEVSDKELIDAVENEDFDEVKKLISAGADVNAKNEYGTPVLSCVPESSLEIAEYLISNGADINGVSKDGDTALHIAVEADEPKMIDFLLSSGADVNSKDGSGRTAIFLAVVNEEQEIVELLLSHGADASVVDGDGISLMDEASDKTEEILNDALDKKHVPSTENLVRAMSERNLDEVNMLISAGADVNARGDTFSMLEYAIYQLPEAIPELVAAGADVDAQDSNGWTALYSAAVGNNAHAVKFLLEAGANIDVENDDGESAYKYAHNHGRRKTIVNIFEEFINNGEIGELAEPVEKKSFKKNLLDVIMDAAHKGAIAGTVSGSSNFLINKINKMLGNPDLLKFGISRPAIKAGIGLCLMTLSNKFSDKVPHPEIVAKTSEMLLSAGAEDGMDEVVALVEPMLDEIFKEFSLITEQQQQLLEGEKKDE